MGPTTYATVTGSISLLALAAALGPIRVSVSGVTRPVVCSKNYHCSIMQNVPQG